MRKTILTLVMMMSMAVAVTAGPAIKATPASKTNVEFKGDSIIVNDGEESVVVSGMPELQKMRDRINEALDDTLTTGSGTSVTIGGHEGDLSPEDIRAISSQWAVTTQIIVCASILGLLVLVLLVLVFRFLNRRSKYRVIEKAIMNNYPLNELTLNDAKRNAIYVQQPVVAAAPQAGQVPVGTPISGKNPSNPVITTEMVNWRALMPAIRVFGWGFFIFLFGIIVLGGHDPFTVVGLALVFVGLCKGFILYMEQKALAQAYKRAQQMQPSEPMREGIPVPPPMDEDYKEDDQTPYQPY